MANIAKTYTLVNGQPADATQVNKNFDDIINGVGDVTTLRPTVAGLGLDADIVTLALPANTTISPAGAELINDADAAAQRVTLGAMSSAEATVTYAQMQHVSAADKVLGRSTAGAGDVEEIPCTAAGRALIALANAPAQMAILGAVSTSDARLSDARPASDVSAWAKAGSKPSYTAAEVGTKKITTGSYAEGLTQGVKTITHGLGTTPTFVLVLCGASTLSVSGMTSTTFSFNTSNNLTYLWFAVA